MELKGFEVSKLNPKKTYTTKVAILRSFLVAASVLLTWFYLQKFFFPGQNHILFELRIKIGRVRKKFCLVRRRGLKS